MQLRSILLALACAGLTSLAHAADHADHNAPTPPAEAFTACAGKAEGASVTLTTPKGDSISATCTAIGGKLAARPDQRPGKGDGKGMGMGGSMGGMQHGNMSMPGHAMQGHENHMQGGRMQPPAEAIAACKGKSEGAKVSVNMPQGNKMSGTCMKMGSDLVMHPDNMPGMGGGQPRN